MSFVHSIIDRHFALVVLQRQVWLRDEQFMQCVFVPQEARVMRRRHVVAICGVHICTSVQQCCHHRRIVVVHGPEQFRCPTDCVTTIIRTAARVKSLENLPSPGGGKSSFFAASTSSAPTVLLRCRFGRAAIASSHPHARTRARRVASILRNGFQVANCRHIELTTPAQRTQTPPTAKPWPPRTLPSRSQRFSKTLQKLLVITFNRLRGGRR